ncbi:MAG: hypothetical protein IV088_04770 [Hydrogenophaga sp.]|uniref:hypothetical protein n=1 Tax=Hydrogenophaga sp. TaxID=1904254 RepID=UPI0025BA9454|nr:hypothetical protein [Hydrogenophaga sp.]MBT9550141.1 hypothetical protein [Hydrogenophaga sp.]
MTQKIDPIKLKATAEHLEWVCQQYPNEERVQGLLESMRSLIDAAKTGKVAQPFADEHRFPAQWAVFSEGLYRDYRDPNVEGAYGDFTDELRGGLTEQDLRIHADMEAQRAAILKGTQS